MTKSNIINCAFKGYHPVRELMKKDVPKYYTDPNYFGEKICRIVSLHDKCADPSQVTMGRTFAEMGFDSLDFVEIMVQLELELHYDFGAADWEQFLTINDISEFLSTDFFAQPH